MAYYDSIRLEKGMYSIPGRSFAQVLEQLDPSEHYKGTALDGMDAYQRQLKRFDIRVSGGGSDVLEKFFQTTDSAALFPEYIARAVRQGVTESTVLPQLVASTTNIDSLDYRTISPISNLDNRELKRVAEGASIPQTTIKLKENLVRLHKRGRMLVASYEAVRFQRLDLFTVALRQIGAYIAKSQLADAVDVLMNGDGNGNPARKVSLAAPGQFTYDELVAFWGEFRDYELNTMLAHTGTMVKLLKLSEFKDPNSGLQFNCTGKAVTPLGAALLRADVVPENTLIGLDKSCALEMVTAGDVSIDYDRLIDRQLERAAISATAGFARVFDDAALFLG